MNKKIRRVLLVITVLALCLPFAACADDTEAINIGVLLPMSGSEAYFGIDMNNAFTLAVEEINEAGGVLGRELNLLSPADDGCDAMMAAQAATLITSSDADFVVGGYCSGATIAALQEFYDNNLIMVISASNSTRITDLGLNQSFMLNSPGTQQIDKLIDVIKHLGVSNVAVIHQGDDFTQNLSDICNEKFPSAGLNIVTTQVSEKGSPDVSAVVTAIRNAEAELVFWGGYAADGGNVIRQLRSGGFEGYIVTADGATSIELIEASGPAGEGVLALSPPTSEFAVGGAEFEAAYMARFGEPSGAYAPLAYDTIYVLKHAIEMAGSTDFEAVRQALQDIDYEAMTGRIVFTADRELRYSNFIVLEITGGTFQRFVVS